jgi:hypothetical protein
MNAPGNAPLRSGLGHTYGEISRAEHGDRITAKYSDFIRVLTNIAKTQKMVSEWDRCE